MWKIIRRSEYKRQLKNEARLVHLEKENMRLIQMHMNMSAALEGMQKVLEKWFK